MIFFIQEHHCQYAGNSIRFSYMKMANFKKNTREYRVIIERDADGYFVGTVPALPGCHTQGKTLEQLHKRLHEVIELCLEEARENPKYRRHIRTFGYEPTLVMLDTVKV